MLTLITVWEKTSSYYNRRASDPAHSALPRSSTLREYIEEYFERRKVIGEVFLDLSSAYDKINHQPMYSIT